ncbi:hypothetical protein EV363DRAFT_1315359 [Boletus edulis]|nr:hypothetical protein EV363DRAFT_1315359 [Boletus edulis]
MPVSGCWDFLLAFLLPRTLAVRLWTFLSYVQFADHCWLDRERYLSLSLFSQHHRLFHMCDREAVHHDGNGCQK